MGNSACQSSSVTVAELALEAALPRQVSPRPSMLQPPTALNLRDVNGHNNEAVLSIRQPRLSFDSKAYQLEMKRRANSKARLSQEGTSDSDILLNHCGSTSTIKQGELQKSFDGGSGQQQTRATRQISTNCKKGDSHVGKSTHHNSSMYQSTGGKLPGRVEEFLQKQSEFVEKRNKQLERLRLLKESQSNKENPHRPFINSKSMKIAEKKCIALREELQEKTGKMTKPSTKQHLKAVRFANPDSANRSPARSRPSARNSPNRITKQPSTISTSTIVLEFDQCLERLRLHRQDQVTYLLFLTIMKDLRMVSEDHTHFDSMPQNQRYLLAEAWKLVKEPEYDNAMASSVLDFLMVLSRNSNEFSRLRPDENQDQNEYEAECDANLMKKFKPFIEARAAVKSHRKSQVIVNQKEKHTRVIDFAPASQKHSRQVSVLSQKTIVQIEVNLGSRVETIRLSKDDDVEEIARKFIKDHGLAIEAEAELVRLILKSLNELH